MAESVLNVVFGFARMAIPRWTACLAPCRNRRAERRFGPGKLPSRSGRTFVPLALPLVLLPMFGRSAAAQPAVRVVTDDNYPPFSFRTSQGELEGIVVDEWRLWEARTGTKVEIRGMDWGEALRRMREGEFDVVDTIFKTDERTAYFDFTEPYARIEVPVFFRKGISGITDLESLKGFPVAAKEGDAAVDLLRKGDITPVLLFSNYLAIIEAAKAHKVNVFVVDKPPALYLLNKLGIEGDFRMSPPIYVGEFRRAVRKGNADLLQRVEQGFADVGDAEFKRVEDKWYGQTLNHRPHLRNLGYAALVLAVVVGLLVGWNWSLTRQVRKRTLALHESETQLRKSRAHLRDLIDGLDPSLFLVLLTPDGKVVEASRSALLLAGRNAQDAPGRLIDEIQPWSQTREAGRSVREAIKRAAQGEASRFDVPLRVAESQLIDMDISMRPLRDESGRTEFIIACGHDITERKQAEERLRHQRQVLRLVLDTYRNVVFVKDRKSRILMANEATANFYGLTVADIVGQRQDELHRQRGGDPTEVEKWLADDRAVLDSGKIVELHETALDHESRVRHYHTHKYPIEFSPGQPAVLVVSMDITDLVETTNTLRQSEERLRLALDAAHMGTFDWDIPGKRITWSRWHEELWGFKPGEFDGTHAAFERRVHPEDQPGVNAEVARCIDGRQPFAHEFRVVWPDGSQHWVAAFGKFEFDDEGQPLRMRGVALETTARKTAENILRRNQQLLQSVTDNIPRAYLSIIHDDMTIGFTSGGEFKRRGLDPTQYIGKTVEEVFLPFGRQIYDEVREHYLKTFAGTGQTFELRLGDEFQVYKTVPLLDAEGRIRRILALVENITEHKQSEAAVRESKTRLEEAQRIAHVGSWEWIAATDTPTWSKELCAILEVDPDKPVPTLAEQHKLYTAATMDRMNAAVEKAMRAGEPYEIELERVRADGSRRWLLARGEPWHDDRGQLVGLRGTALEITERKLAEAALRARARQQETAARLAQVALTTPLPRLFEEATRVLADTLEVEFSKVLKLLPDRSAMQLVAGVGWHEGLVGQTTVPTNRGSQGGFTLLSDAPVLVEDLSTDNRFTGPPLLTDHGVVSGMSVVVRCAGGPWGVLGTHTRKRRSFSRNDVHFFETVAGILGGAIERQAAEEALRESEERLLKAQHVARMGFLDWDLETDKILLSEETRSLYGLQPEESRTASELLARSVHPDDLDRVRQALDLTLRGEQPYDIEHRIVRPDGTTLWTHSQAEVFYDAEHKPRRVLGTSIDITARKQAEEARRESEATYRTLVESASDGIFIADAQGRYLDVNAQGCRMLGYDRGEILDRSIGELAVGEEKARVPEELARLNTGQGVRSEWQLQRKDGTILPGEVSATQLSDGRLLGILRDITERKQAEESLRRSEERFRELAETIQEVFWMTDPEKQRMLYISPAYEKIWGQTCQSLYDNPKSWIDAIHPDDRERVVLAAETRQSKGSYEEEYRIVRPDGQMRWIYDRAFPVRSPAGQIERIVGVARDITKTKTVEEELHQREEHFRLLIENASDVITVINSQGIMRYQSPSIGRVLGYAPEALIGRNAFELVHPEDAAPVAEAIQRALANPGAPVSAEYRIRHQNDQWRTFHSLGRSISGKADEGYIVVNSRDITETRQLEVQFRQAQKMEAIGQLAGGVAHDFNNILTAILMQVGLARVMATVPPEVQEGLEEIKAAAERAANLTRQLLLFSRKQVMQPHQLDLNEVVTSLAKMLQRIIGEDVHLELHPHPAPLMIRADGGMLDQMLLNLAINARDAMAGGGRLNIETSLQVVNDVMARSHPDATPGRFAVVSVSDTGSGIPPEVLPRIFEPFFTTKEPGKGTGLGLATVFGIVKQHGGWIKVQSEPGQGSRFQIFLPASTDRMAAGAETRQKPRGGTETILLVEDNDAVRRLTQITLTRHGYRVVEAASGVEAVKRWTECRGEVALLLTDIVMPDGMSGQQLAQQLHNDLPRLKVIYTSGYSAEIAGRELKLRSGENFLQKPCPPDRLLETVRRCLDS